MPDLEQSQGFGIAIRAETGAVVGHNALNLDTVDSEEVRDIEQEADAGRTLFIGQHLRASEAGMVIDRQMERLPQPVPRLSCNTKPFLAGV